MVTVGGTIPADDIPELKQLGVAEVFTPGAPTQDIIDFIQGAVASGHPAEPPRRLIGAPGTSHRARLTRQSTTSVHSERPFATGGLK